MFESLLTPLAPVIEALLRVMVGLALVPHGLRITFGFFAHSGLKVRNLTLLAAQLDGDGYRPGRLWAPLISLTELVAGPLLALGLFTRIAAVPIVIFLARVVLGALAQGRLVLEHAGARIHPDVDDRGGVFSGARRRDVFAGLFAVRLRDPTYTRDVIARASGQSSTPGDSAIVPRRHGVLDAPLSRGNDNRACGVGRRLPPRPQPRQQLRRRIRIRRQAELHLHRLDGGAGGDADLAVGAADVVAGASPAVAGSRAPPRRSTFGTGPVERVIAGAPVSRVA